jgi:hypothetical protein
MWFGRYRYRTAEAAYQSQKTLSDIQRQRIQKAIFPGEAKRIGRRLKLRADWEEVKDDVMYRVVKKKFESHPDIADKLMATGDAELMEGNYWGDRYWGVDSKTGKGKNMLGQILMRVRSELRGDEVDGWAAFVLQVYKER